MGKKKFAAAALDPKHKTYVVYVGSVTSNVSPGFSPLDVYDALSSSSPLNVHPSRRPQISGLIAEEAPIKVSAKYSDFADEFSSDLAFELLEHIGINNHAIELVDSC